MGGGSGAIPVVDLGTAGHGREQGLGVSGMRAWMSLWLGEENLRFVTVMSFGRGGSISAIGGCFDVSPIPQPAEFKSNFL